MPRELTEQEAAKALTGPAVRSKYDWDKWTDGKAREFTKGVDFHCGIESFRNAAWQISKRYRLVLKSVAKGDAVTLQFFRPNDSR